MRNRAMAITIAKKKINRLQEQEHLQKIEKKIENIKAANRLKIDI